MLGISLTDIQWGSFSALVALFLHELLVCPPSLHYINTRFVHYCPLWPQTEATPFICHPRSHTHLHVYMTTRLCSYLFLGVCLCMCLESWCLTGFLFLSKLAMKCWSTCSAQVNPSHPFEPPLLKHPFQLCFFTVHEKVETTHWPSETTFLLWYMQHNNNNTRKKRWQYNVIFQHFECCLSTFLIYLECQLM